MKLNKKDLPGNAVSCALSWLVAIIKYTVIPNNATISKTMTARHMISFLGTLTEVKSSDGFLPKSSTVEAVEPLEWKATAGGLSSFHLEVSP